LSKKGKVTVKLAQEVCLSEKLQISNMLALLLDLPSNPIFIKESIKMRFTSVTPFNAVVGYSANRPHCHPRSFGAQNRSAMKYALAPGLPDGLFSNQKSKFG
jgi:hypothetical protein